MSNQSKPKIAISSCLLGNNVRYNRSHCSDKWVINKLSEYVELIPVCPEMAMGLGTPREEIHLQYNKQAPSIVKLIGKKSKTDLTALAKSTYESMNRDIEIENVDGFILTKKSPSCGLGTAKLAEENNRGQVKHVDGLYAQSVKENFPLMPIIDSGRINNEQLREQFVQLVFAHYRFSLLDDTTFALQEFHKKYKYILMEHNQRVLKKLGSLVANNNKMPISDLKVLYKHEFFGALSTIPTRKNRYNTLVHLLGYFKKLLSATDKSHLLNLMNEYKAGMVSYQVIIRVYHFITDKYEVSYLDEQYFFNRYPKTLKLEAAI